MLPLKILLSPICVIPRKLSFPLCVTPGSSHFPNVLPLEAHVLPCVLPIKIPFSLWVTPRGSLPPVCYPLKLHSPCVLPPEAPFLMCVTPKAPFPPEACFEKLLDLPLYCTRNMHKFIDNYNNRNMHLKLFKPVIKILFTVISFTLLLVSLVITR